jgi:hypothetical protein
MVIAVFAIAALMSCSSEDPGAPSTSVAGIKAPSPTPDISIVNGITHVVIHLSPTEGEGQVGTATFSTDGMTTTVEVSIAPAATEAQPMHIHAGICTDVGTVLHALQNVVRGSSTTIIDVSLEEIINDGALVNVHASYADASTYTACGQLPAELQ